jgi:hypothetical protein
MSKQNVIQVDTDSEEEEMKKNTSLQDIFELAKQNLILNDPGLLKPKISPLPTSQQIPRNPETRQPFSFPILQKTTPQILKKSPTPKPTTSFQDSTLGTLNPLKPSNPQPSSIYGGLSSLSADKIKIFMERHTHMKAEDYATIQQLVLDYHFLKITKPVFLEKYKNIMNIYPKSRSNQTSPIGNNAEEGVNVKKLETMTKRITVDVVPPPETKECVKDLKEAEPSKPKEPITPQVMEKVNTETKSSATENVKPTEVYQEKSDSKIVDLESNETIDEEELEFHRQFQFEQLFGIHLPNKMLNSIFNAEENKKLLFFGKECLEFCLTEYLFTSIKFGYSEFLEDIKEKLNIEICENLLKYEFFLSEEEELTANDVFTALIACIMINSGLESCKEFLLKFFIPEFHQASSENFKEISSKSYNFNQATEYEIERENIPN